MLTSCRHGRDHKLIVWKLDEESEQNLSKAPPLEDTAEPRAQPWVMHVLNVNTMNFCAFAVCPKSPDLSDIDTSDEILVAVPNALGSEAVSLLVFAFLRFNMLTAVDGHLSLAEPG